jgi:sugar/nucleoside kinase (ribokinase family)
MRKFLVSGVTFVDINSVITNEGSDLSIQSDINIGGKGYNIAKALGVLNQQAQLHTFLGADIFGDRTVLELTKYEITVSESSFATKRNTPIATLVNYNGGLLFDKVDTSVFNHFVDPIISSEITDIIVFSHTANSTFEKIKEVQKERQLQLHLSIAGSRDIPALLNNLYNVKTLFANKIETESLLEYSGFNSIEQLMKSYRISEFVSTKDSDGAIVYILENEIYKQISVPNYMEYVSEIINTVGAGDILVASYLAFREKLNPEDALNKAMHICAFHIRNNNSSLIELPTNL